jgi:putative PEP-CTERM system TPR-repeat lipoprotein
MPFRSSVTTRLLTAGALCVCVIGAGCADRSASEALDAARVHLAANRRAEAILELKNALQADGNLAEARLLLGQALMDAEDAASAVVELEKARAAGLPADRVLPPLARAMLLAQRSKAVLALDHDAPSLSPEATADFKTTVARAHAATGDRVAAERVLERALEARSDHVPALILGARLTAGRGDVAAALVEVRRILAMRADAADAHLLEGELLQRSGADPVAAVDAYRAALAAEPGHLSASAALVLLQVERGDLPAAQAEVKRLKQIRPRHAQTHFLEALLAHLTGDDATAYERSRSLAGLAGDNPQVLQLAGAAALRVGHLEEATGHLGKLVQLLPDFAPGRLLLARVHLRAGRADAALAAARPLLDDSHVDPQLLSVAAQAHLLRGDDEKAEALFRRAAKSDDPASQAALAMAQIGRGDAQAGMNRLAELARRDQGTTAGLALVVARLMQRDPKGALTALDDLDRKQPRQPQLMFLRGQILARQGDAAGARQQYEAALENSPGFFAAVDALAGLDLSAQRPQEARARFERLLREDAGNAMALQALAQLDETAGKPAAEVSALLQRAVRASPNDASIRRRLIGYHLRKGDARQAVVAAQEAVAALPDDPVVQEALATAQAAAGETMQAVSSYARLVTMLPRSAESYLGLAKIYLQAKDRANAVAALRNAVDLAQDAPDLLQRAAGLYVLAEQHGRALQLATHLRSHVATAAMGLELAGDIEASRGGWAKAAAAYRAALAKDPGTRLSRSLHQVLYRSDRDAAKKHADSWMRTHPSDMEFLFSVGGIALAARDFATAEASYLSVLKSHPDQPLALNNLAWAMRGLNKVGAIHHAERANELMPSVPGLMDTWALLLSDAGRFDQALTIQQRAIALEPGKPSLRLTLARIHLKAGNKAAARAELEHLSSLGDRFGEQAEVRALLAGT